MAAATQGHVSVVRILLQDGRQCVNQVKRQGLSALWLALADNHDLTVEVLLQHPAIVIAAPNMRGYTLLQQAVINNGQCRMVHVLLAHPRMSVAQRDAAAFGGNAWPCGALTALLQCPQTALNARDNLGRTSLLLAAAGDAPQTLCRLLTVAGVDITAADTFGSTALILAAGAGHADVARAQRLYSAGEAVIGAS
ncbi:ankyrin repeat domain-containing protein [Sodalis-like symbiont of Bactericera trigonica]|nr:ankyrin repeat domain-containing protein [Sodalis-like symbiont of Bactericera trigonica]